MIHDLSSIKHPLDKSEPFASLKYGIFVSDLNNASGTDIFNRCIVESLVKSC